jgi:hypothetical protein
MSAGSAAALLALAAALAAAPRAAVAAAFEEPVRLGTSEAELREHFGEALAGVAIRRAHPVHAALREVAPPREGAPRATPPDAKPTRPPPDAAAPTDAEEPYAGQLRLARRVAEGDVGRVEYDLHGGRGVRIRWQLAERFERPLMQALVSHLSERLGPPSYDQTIEAKLGSGKATLRRAGWKRGERALEVRQLHPLTGGPLFVTRSDLAALQEIVAAGGVLMPEPDTSEDWWRRPQKPPRLPTSQEIAELVAAVDALVGAGP